MNAKLITIGNSKGVRLPKKLIEKYHLHDSLNLEEKNDGILIKADLPENKLTWEETVQYGHRCYRACERNIRIYVADFIQLSIDYDGLPLETLYDRAALVALPEDMRAPYVKACRKLLVTSFHGLLISLEYDVNAMEGPPFSVTCEEVERLWEAQLDLVEQVDMLSSMPRAIASGVQCLYEYFWIFRQSGTEHKVE